MSPPKILRLASATYYDHHGLHVYGVYEIKPTELFAIHEGYWDWGSKWNPTPSQSAEWIPRRDMAIIYAPRKQRTQKGKP